MVDAQPRPTRAVDWQPSSWLWRCWFATSTAGGGKKFPDAKRKQSDITARLRSCRVHGWCTGQDRKPGCLRNPDRARYARYL